MHTSSEKEFIGSEHPKWHSISFEDSFTDRTATCAYSCIMYSNMYNNFHHFSSFVTMHCDVGDGFCWWSVSAVHVDYRITSKYSNAFRTSQTFSFAKWYHILHPRFAIKAPWSCARDGIKSFHYVILYVSLNQCWKARLFEYLAAIRYTQSICTRTCYHRYSVLRQTPSTRVECFCSSSTPIVTLTELDAYPC